MCWYHNAAHYIGAEHKCTSKIDEATGKTTCRYKHEYVKKEVFDAMPTPGKGKGKGKTPKGGGKERARSPGGRNHCFEFMNTGACARGANCHFEHISKADAQRLGLTAPKGGGKGRGKKGKDTAPAQQVPPGQEQAASSLVPAATLQMMHTAQDSTAAAYAAEHLR